MSGVCSTCGAMKNKGEACDDPLGLHKIKVPRGDYERELHRLRNGEEEMTHILAHSYSCPAAFPGGFEEYCNCRAKIGFNPETQSIEYPSVISIRSERKDEKHLRVTAWLNGKMVGEMQVESTALVHGMEITQSPIARHVADALLNYAKGYVKASGFNEALVLIQEDNDKMHAYVQPRATEEPKSRAYMMSVE